MENNALREAARLRSELVDHISKLKAQISTLSALVEAAEMRLKVVEDYINVATQPLDSSANFDSLQVGPERGTESEQTSRRRRRNPTSPRVIADMAKAILLEAGRPMTRGELAKALEANGAEIVAADKAKNVGTILWRHGTMFENLPGEGYWVIGEPRSKD